MNTSFNLSMINASNTDIYIQPQDKREFNNGFNSSKLNFTWNVTSYHNDTMDFKLAFENPLEVSPSIINDKVIIFFN